MGIDAEMFVKVKGRDNFLRGRLLNTRCNQLINFIGKEPFMAQFAALKAQYPVMKVIDAYHQDGPTLECPNDEQWIRVYLMGRYYGEGYERGDWSKLGQIMRWLYENMPEGSEVWYGGDSSGVCAEHYPLSRVDAMDVYWHANKNEPYINYFRRS